MDECKTDARPSLAQMESLHGPDWSPAAPPVSGDGDAAGGLVCYSCGNGFADICPLCGRAVCAACAEREGECCCDQPPGDEITEIARKWYTKGTARNAMGPAMYQAVREAYAAGLERGRALGAREALQEAESCARAHRALDADTDLWRGYDAAALEIADALAARRSGGQGK
jgi:hypothetical protein